MRLRSSLQAISSVAVKEFIHIYRDWRILVLLLILPPVFTLIFGHAFETTGSSNVPALLENRDESPASEVFVRQLKSEATFKWKTQAKISGHPDLLREHVQAALVIPRGLGREPEERRSDSAPALSRRQRHQHGERTGRPNPGKPRLIPEEAARGDGRWICPRRDRPGKKIAGRCAEGICLGHEPVGADRRRCSTIPDQRFIEYVVPGIIGIILQLLTVTLTACTIARERESGTLYQLMVTSLRRGEIVIGKILPYLAISILLILVVIVVAGWHFHVAFHQLPVLAVICLLFLLCSLGLGLLISAFSRTQTQAIQLSVFFLLPIFVLSGAFAPLEQLPLAIRYLSELFPLTHFCRAFRLVNLYHAGPGLLRRRSHLHAGRDDRDLRRRGAPLEAHPGVEVDASLSAARPGEATSKSPLQTWQTGRLRSRPSQPRPRHSAGVSFRSQINSVCAGQGRASQREASTGAWKVR